MHRTMNRNLPDPNSYLMMLKSVASDYLVVAKVRLVRGRLLKNNDRAEKDALEIWKKLIRNLPFETIEALEALMKKRLDTFYAAKSQLQVQRLEKDKKKKRSK